ncbi:MAG TPA: cupin domain-containing protein [Pyrinomonadaceae bacterium]|nr:cupin domain-containing protein [Pyrinomonadaceae bacterium]
MAVLLEGGCRVAQMREGIPQVDGTLKMWTHIGPETRAKAVSLRILEFGPGASPTLNNDQCDEVLFSLDSCKLFIDNDAHDIERESGVFIPSQTAYRIENSGTTAICFVSVKSPASDASRARVVKLSDQRAMPTGDRWYRVLIDSEVTQFVGSIPPGRAPDHFHEYEEVLFILRGEGRMWTEARSTPIAYGCCVYLPRRQVHCVKNTGDGELRVLGVFYPAGSPAVRYETATQSL